MKKTEQKVINFIDEKSLISADDKILVALSGGPDSVFLLFFLNKFKKRFRINIGAFHVNHLLRRNDSDKDEEFCKLLCRKLSIPFSSVKKNAKLFAKKNKISLEEAGRNIRYIELEKFSKKNSYSKIATAHNCNDNSETVFLNLIKGTGIKGIAGIPFKRDKIIRPLICLTKDEILSYLNVNKIEYRIDATNNSSNYERNFLRNEIFPAVKKRLNASLDETLLTSSEIFKGYLSLSEKLLKEFYKKISFEDGRLFLPVSVIEQIHPELLGDFFKTVIERNFSVQVKFKDIKQLKNLLTKQTGRIINLQENLTGLRERDDIIVYKPKEVKEFHPVKIKCNENTLWEDISLSIIAVNKSELRIDKEKRREYISADNVEENFILRKWTSGDKFFPIGFNGSKKISDFLNEQKIPSSKKNKQLVLTNKNRIVWVVGLRLDDRFKITNSTKKVYKLCLN